MNVVNLIGRVTKDVELRTSSGGKTFAGFTLAVNEYYNGQQNAQFIPCLAWEKTAENMAKYVKKGSLISVEGSLSIRNQNNNGQFTTITNVRVSRVEFLSTQPKDIPATVSQPNNNHNTEFEIEDNSQNNQSYNDDILWDE